MEPIEINAIVDDYLTGTSVIELARKYRRTNRTISSILHEAGVAGTLRQRAADRRRGHPGPVYLTSGGLAGTLDAPRWAYVAGLLDGEGSIVTRGVRNGVHRRYSVQIAQKDDTPLIFIKAALGVGQIYKKQSLVHSYHLDAQQAAFEFLCAVLPYLIVKRDKALVAIESLSASYGWEVPV